MTAVCVPLLAVAPLLGVVGVVVAAKLILLERVGKAVRSPAKSALLARMAASTGRGRGFAVHKALVQVGTTRSTRTPYRSNRSPVASAATASTAIAPAHTNGTEASVALLGLCAFAAAAAAMENATRATTWRQIAIERRWNHEKQAGHRRE